MPISFAEASRRLYNVAETIGGPGSKRALTAAGVEAKNVMSAFGRRDHLSGYGRGARRGRVDAVARFDTLPGLKIEVAPTKPTRGLWALLEEGSGTTWKTPRRRGRRRARGTVGTYRRAPVRARRTWSDGEPQASRQAFGAYHRKLQVDVVTKLRGG